MTEVSSFLSARRCSMAKRTYQPVLAGFESSQDLQQPTAELVPHQSSPTGSILPSTATSPDGFLAGQTVYVVDAHSLIYQVFHALPEMSGPSGQPVAAVQGFIRDVLDLIEAKGAVYLICPFDHPARTFRHDVDDQYKIGRAEMPADLQLQSPVIRRFLGALGVLLLEVEGYEADDILATVARQVESASGRCLLVTSDKDCRQLIS